MHRFSAVLLGALLIAGAAWAEEGTVGACDGHGGALAGCSSEEGAALLQLPKRGVHWPRKKWTARSWPWSHGDQWWKHCGGKKHAGLAIATNYLHQDGFQGMSVGLGVGGADSRPQQALIDSGSSSIAFCDRALAKGVEKQRTTAAQCNQYGNADGEKDNNPNKPCFFEYFYGSVYQGDVQAFDGLDGRVAADMKDVSYTIMDYQQHMTCELGFQGIFGIAFGALNYAYEVPDGNASQMLETCGVDVLGRETAFCNTASLKGVQLTSPLAQSLQANGVNKTGIYFDYGATAQKPEPFTMEGLGMVYIGQAAVENEFFKHALSLMTVTTVYRSVGESGAQLRTQQMYWDLAWIGAVIQDGDKNITVHPPDANFCRQEGRCIFDTGNPSLTIPLIIVKECLSNEHGTVTFSFLKDIAKQGQATASLEVPCAFIVEQYQAGWVTPSATSFVLGMPILQYYYVVLDDDADTMTFARLPQAA